jgi:SecY translocase
MAEVDGSRPDGAILVKVAALVGALAVFALGSALPLPGLDPVFVAGLALPARARLSVLALGVTPLVSSVLILEIARLISPQLARCAARPGKAQTFDRAAWVLALALAAVQGLGLSQAIERINGPVAEPGAEFTLGVVATTVGATAVLGSLSLFVTRVGAGDGLLIFYAAPMLVGMAGLAGASLARGGEGEAPFALVVVAAAAAALAWSALVSRLSARGALGFGGGALDPLPALVAMNVARLPAALLESTVWPSLDFRGVGGLSLTAATGAGLIALTAAMRPRLPDAPPPPRAPWPATGAVILVCAGLPFVQAFLPAAPIPSGYGLVFVVAAAMSVVDGIRDRRG